MDFRTLLLGVGVFCATFLVGWWLNVGGLSAGFSHRPITEAQEPMEQSATTTGQRVAIRTPQAKMPSASNWSGRGLVGDKLLRDVVTSSAEKYQDPPCNQDVRWLYTKHATEYGEALLRAAGCSSQRCPFSTARLQRVWEENRSALDRPVALAMAGAHAAGGLSERNFPGDTGRAVQVIAGRYFEPGPPPACSNRTTRGWSFRIRRR
jgi:hypothetical protein